jgi:chemotaxis-related protein WspB
MLFLLFHLGQDRYALQASHVVEVLPLVAMKRLPQAPTGVAGVFNYRGRLVPAVDLALLTLGQPAARRLSTRIVLVNYASARNQPQLLGLIAEGATEMLRTDIRNFVNHGLQMKSAPYLGPVLLDPNGPIQWLDEQRLLSGPLGQFLATDSRLLEMGGGISDSFPPQHNETIPAPNT